MSNFQTLLIRPKGYLTSSEEKLNIKVEFLLFKLGLCGRRAKTIFHCQKVPSDQHILKKTPYEFHHCETHFCPKPHCLVQRFARNINTFNNISRFDGLNNLWHFAISFEKISLHDFKYNFGEIRKRQNAVLNSFFSRLKKQGLQIQSIRVFDLSFEEEGKVLPHYHFGAIPIGSLKRRDAMLLVQKTRMGMISRMRVSTPFHFQSFGVKNKSGVLSYLAKRSAGLYTYEKSSSVEYIPSSEGKLLKDIKNKKYFTLHDVLTPEQYIKDFYNRPHFVTIGSLPRPLHGSILTDSMPSRCPIHGKLDREHVRFEKIFEELSKKEAHHPPPTSKGESLVIEYVKII